MRDYLAASTVLSRSPLTERQVATIRGACRARQLTPIWFPGVLDDELNQPDELPGPPGSRGDWYHDAARRILSEDRAAFYRSWAFDVRPARDDRPYFHDFFKWSAVEATRRTYGDLWLTHAELGFLFVLAAIVVTGVTGALLTLLPLAWMRGGDGDEGVCGPNADRPARPGRAATLVYFAAIGLAYMLLEIAMIGRLTQLIGDPTLAASACLVGFLICSGVGSAWAGRSPLRSSRALGVAIVGIVLIGSVETSAFGWIFAGVAGAPPAVRYGLGLGLIAPMAVLMGWPMPTGLARLRLSAGDTRVAWAWGINGFASVVAASVATALAMSVGFTWLIATAMGFYLVAGAVYPRLASR